MTDSTDTFRLLTQESFAGQIDTLLKQSEAKLAQLDEQLMVHEVDVTFCEEQLKSLEEQISTYREKRNESAERFEASQQQMERAQKRQAFLQDVQGLLKGELFDQGADSAQFFTFPQDEMAHRIGVGEMTLEGMMKASKDGFRLEHADKVYCFVMNRQGRGFFHPDGFSFEISEQLFDGLVLSDD